MVDERRVGKEWRDLMGVARVLQDKHFVWIVVAAMEVFTKRVEDAETEIARHTARISTGSTSFHSVGQERARHERNAELLINIQQYELILEFLRKLRELLVEKSAQKWAEDLFKKGPGR